MVRPRFPGLNPPKVWKVFSKFLGPELGWSRIRVMESMTTKREIDTISDPKFPGRIAVIEEETGVGRYEGNHPYGIGIGYNLSIYFTDILVYETSYFGDADGLRRAKRDAESFLRGELPVGFYHDSSVTFADVRFDKEKP